MAGCSQKHALQVITKGLHASCPHRFCWIARVKALWWYASSLAPLRVLGKKLSLNSITCSLNWCVFTQKALKVLLWRTKNQNCMWGIVSWAEASPQKTSARRQWQGWYPMVSCHADGLPVIGRLTPGRAIIRKFSQASGNMRKEHCRDSDRSLQSLRIDSSDVHMNVTYSSAKFSKHHKCVGIDKTQTLCTLTLYKPG